MPKKKKKAKKIKTKKKKSIKSKKEKMNYNKINHTINEIPDRKKKKYLWQKENLENQTGTPNAYKPSRISKSNNQKKKYETWKN